jgi:hypothetical protein
MAKPKLNYCLICEEIRAEQGNKLTILGLYGISPDVDIIFGKLGTPTRIMFLTVAARGEDHAYVVLPQVVNDKGEVLAKGKPIELVIVKGANAMFGFGFFPIAFPKEGLYFFELSFNGESTRFSFRVREGPTPSFSPSASASPSA